MLQHQRMGQRKSKPKPDSESQKKVTVESNADGGNTDQHQNGGGPEQTKTEGDDVIVQQRKNGEGAARVSKRKRTSFYETVDASEVLPYLIIGQCKILYVNVPSKSIALVALEKLIWLYLVGVFSIPNLS